ncbi:hypothetical protein G9A89_002602 [Geosiphon pyriformis]|nr:hypothetical protein G9A89_002602 [Geosiphon pyriformis]
MAIMDVTKESNKPITHLDPDQTPPKMLPTNRIISLPHILQHQPQFLASSITELIAKMGNCVIVSFKTEKLSSQRTLKALQAEEIQSERILKSILRAVSIRAMGQIFVRTLSHL